MSASMMHCKQCPPAAKQQGPKGPTLSLHDPEYKNMITAPLSAVHHLPAAHLEISRLVLCKSYDPRDPVHSCKMGPACKFVHVDMTAPGIKTQSIHVNYAYRSLAEVRHERLPAGEMISVMPPNTHDGPVQQVPSEMVLVTRGALNPDSTKKVQHHCAHYYLNRTCTRGERCSFLHCVHINPHAADFQRALPRAGASVVSPTPSNTPMVVPPAAHYRPAKMNDVSSNSSASCDLTDSPRSDRSEATLSPSADTASTTLSVYRHDPYSPAGYVTL